MKKSYAIILQMFLFLTFSLSFAQVKNISGTIFDETQSPIPGVLVYVEGGKGVATDFDGKYSIMAKPTQTIIFNYLGYVTQRIQVGQKTTITVTMVEDAESLDEILVTAYGTTSRAKNSASISTVSAKELKNYVPSTSIDNILQGQASGVQVTAANGRPGNTGFVQIRGVGSINSSTTPLYIIDGVPIPINESEQFNPLNNINPGDIESVSILKDAASTSRYGSRGANGVILITTKKGKPGEAKITFTSSYGFGSRIEDPFDLMNAEQKLRIEKEYADLGVEAATSLPGATATDAELAALIALDTDWEEELLRRSIIRSNNLSISGGSDDLTYFFSLGHDSNTGIIDGIDGYERVSGRLNTTYQAKKWLNIEANISASRSTTDLPRDRNNVQNPFRAMYDYNPYATLYARDESGAILLDENNEAVYNTGNGIGFNIAEALQTEPEDSRNLTVISNIAANIDFSKKLTNRFAVGLVNNRFNSTSRSIAGGVLQGFIGNADFPGTQDDDQSIDLEYNVNNVFTYSDIFNEKHNLSTSLLLEYNEYIRTELSVSARGFPTPDIPYLDVAAEATDAESNEARRRLFSQAIFADYDYDEKYIVTASVRRDGSTRFSTDNQYGTFASGSLAWNLAKESFMDSSVFNDLKIRTSYGTTGNQNIGDFEYLDLAEFNTYNGNTTVIPLQVGNPDIKWEGQTTLDVGLEFSLFNNRINGVVDYFQKNSTDLLLDTPISNTVGDENNAIFQNIGEVQNRGFEISLNADIVRTNDLLVSAGGNITFLDTEVISLKDGQDIIFGTFGNIILREGEEINSFYLVDYAGVNSENGAPQYLDSDGNITEEYSDDFLKIQEGKSPIPDMQGGFYTNIRYKGIGLRADFAFSAGNYILNIQRQSGIEIGNIDSNLRTEAFNYWKQPGDTNVLPSPLFQSTADQSGTTRFLEKGDYIRLRTLTLDYTLPDELIQSLPIDRLRIFATGQNILTFTDYQGDPEIGLGSAESGEPGDEGFVAGEFSLFSYPQTKSYTLGIEIGF